MFLKFWFMVKFWLRSDSQKQNKIDGPENIMSPFVYMQQKFRLN